MQQEQCPANGVGRTELIFQQSRHVSSAPRRARLVQHSLEFRFTMTGQFGRLSMRLLGHQSAEAAISIGVDPTLNEPAATTEALPNFRLTPSLQGQHHRTIAIPLLSVRLFPHQLPKQGQFFRTTRRHLHDGFLSDGIIAAE